MVSIFFHFFDSAVGSEFVINGLLKTLPHIQRIGTLPREVLMSVN